jgi:hypothetical protein
MLWIRDGVLVDRMPVNAVAFAVACLTHADGGQSQTTDLTDLINYAFETSGISCADKIRKFNSERFPLVSDVVDACDYYNRLATHAASRCEYFDGACSLVKNLHECGVLNFITSAVEQDVLNAWARSEHAKPIAPYLTEILGRRSDSFTKGRDHFAYMRDRYNVSRIYYVADAIAEISTGAQYSSEVGIVPIGFAHLITPEKISKACDLVLDAHARLSPAKAQQATPPMTLDAPQLTLPTAEELTQSLQRANATHVVTGPTPVLMKELANYLRACGVLPGSS